MAAANRPVELVSSQLKGRLMNRVFLNLGELTAAIREEIKRLEKDASLVKTFFYKKEIAFITD